MQLRGATTCCKWSHMFSLREDKLPNEATEGRVDSGCSEQSNKYNIMPKE